MAECAACGAEGASVPIGTVEGAVLCEDARRCLDRACPKRRVVPLNGERRRSSRRAA